MTHRNRSRMTTIIIILVTLLMVFLLYSCKSKKHYPIADRYWCHTRSKATQDEYIMTSHTFYQNGQVVVLDDQVMDILGDCQPLDN